MLRKTKTTLLILCATSLAACTSYNPHGYANYRSYLWEGQPLYPESYEDEYHDHPSSSSNPKKEVVVPESYHVGPYASPVKPKDRDQTWVATQNPQGYTIELSDQEKASEVAGKLQQAPKENHRAEVRYEREGKTHYKGLYGTYPSYEAAEQALDALPEAVRAGARIQSWREVQKVVR
jgi:septal ring-binding cell division protein DamX